MNEIKYPSLASEMVALMHYCRWDDSKNRRENWSEVIQRVVGYLQSEITNADKVPKKVWAKIKKGLEEFNVFPSMRLVSAAGVNIDHAAMYNCAYLPIDSVDAFSEILYLLSLGVGVGYSVEKEFVRQLPIVKVRDGAAVETFIIPDSRIGWADALKKAIISGFNGDEVLFDYSKIRPAGQRLKTFGGYSSGSGVLKELLDFVAETMLNAVGRQLTSLETHDICCMIAKSIISGGRRRSAMIAFTDLDDMLMAKCKHRPFPEYRYFANITAVFKNKPNSVDFLRHWSLLASSGTGERGIYNLTSVEEMYSKSDSNREFSSDMRTNPCFTGDTKVAVADGRGEVEFYILAKEGKDVPVYCVDDDGSIVVRTMRNIHRTGIDVLCSKVFLGNNYVIEASDTHEFFLRDGSKKKLYELSVGDELRIGVKDGDIFISIKDSYTDDTFYTVRSIKSCGNQDVYNGTVDEFHNYFVGGFAIDIGHSKIQYVNAKNCGETILRPNQFCNLSEVVVRKEDELSDLIDKLKTSTWLSMMQSTLQEFDDYLRPIWKENAQREKLLGVSLSGLLDNLKLVNSDTVLQQLHKVVLRTAKHAAKILDISVPAAACLIKPSGSTSQLSNASPGLHSRYGKFYIRRYRIQKNDPLWYLLKDQNVPLFIENGQVEASATTYVVEFPIKSPAGAITRDEWDSFKQVDWYFRLQEYWSDMNCSTTVYVEPENWLSIGAYVLENFSKWVGLTFFPYSDFKYQLAPYEEITKEEYEKRVAEFPDIDFSKLPEYEQITGDTTTVDREFACSGGACDLA